MKRVSMRFFDRIRRRAVQDRDLSIIRSSDLFEKAWYLSKNPDVAEAGVDPYLHYLLHGGFEHRDPGPEFSSSWYLETYADVREEHINPLLHYLKYGKPENRLKRPEITVVIPLYNKLDFFRACLDSVLDQSGVTLEVVCVDDNSTDGSWEIALAASKDDSRLRVFRNKENMGPGPSRNVGISLARGRYIQFLDADDLLPAGALKSLLEAAERTGSDVVRGAFRTLQDGTVVPWSGDEIIDARVGSLLDLPELWVPWYHGSFLISHQLLQKEQIFYPHLRLGQDPPFLASVLTRAHRICIILQAAYIYRPGSKSAPRFGDVQDYIAHALLVKQIYAGPYECCWKKYHEFILGVIQTMLTSAYVTVEEYLTLENRIKALE
jgi:glycosyltransferase involved in cell wall biosynthesis